MGLKFKELRIIHNDKSSSFVVLLDSDNSVSIQIRSLQVLYYNNNVHLLWHCCNLKPADFDLLPDSVIRYTGDGKSKFKGFQ